MPIAIVAGAVATVTVAALVVALFTPAAADFWLSLERRRSRLTRRSIRISGFDMPYLEGGRGEVLLLAHGFGGDKDNFTRIARFLVPHFRVVIPDLPGFGDATRDPTARYDISSQVDRLHCFAQALDLAPHHLGGNSMGGFIAAQYAATHPADVRSLWLLNAAGFEGAFETEAIRGYAGSGETVLLLDSPAAFDVLMATATFRSPWLPPALRRALALRGVRDRSLHERIFREIGAGSPTLERLAARIRAPTLIVWGREDRILNPAVGSTMRSLVPDSELLVLEATGHLPMIERPGRTAAEFVAFVARRISARGAAPRA